MDVRNEIFPLENSVEADRIAMRKSYKAGDSVLGWMRLISRNIGAPARLLRQLAASADSELRMAVAEHVNIPAELLLLLSADVDDDVRYSIAENHNVSRAVLRKLLADENPYVAARAAKTLARLKTGDSLFSAWPRLQTA